MRIFENTAIVVDYASSGLGTAAFGHSAVFGGEVIVATHFSSPVKLQEYLAHRNFKFVFFSWRKGLTEFLYFLNKSPIKLEYRIFLVVADNVGLDNTHAEEKLLSVIDGYLVTNEQLKIAYESKFALPCGGIWRDLPNLDLVNEILNLPNSESARRRKIIWVGNSRWGERQGYRDHKGFNRYVRPLIKDLQNEIDFVIVDSAVELYSNKFVLTLMKDCDLLVQVSDSEGTGLPILEALALGLTVLTTNVGIVPEISGLKELNVIHSLNYSELLSRVKRLLEEADGKRISNFKIFTDYLEMVKDETPECFQLSTQDSTHLRPILVSSNYLKLKAQLYWILRRFFLSRKFNNKISR